MVLAHGPFKNSFQATIGYLNLPTCLWVIRGGETVSNSIFKHDLCKLVIAKMGSAITYDSTRSTESGEESFKKFANNSGVERPYEIDAPHVKDFTNLDGILRHFITLRNFSLTLARVAIFNQLVCIFVNSGPKETGIKDLFGGEICNMMSPGGSIVASFEDVESFFVVRTPSDHLIRTYFEQEVMFNIFEILVLLLGRHPFNNEIPRVYLSPVTDARDSVIEREWKAKNILLMAIPKEHMRRFYGMDDAKEIWEAIRTRFGGNANSKKMQKAVFKQQFEAFKISNSEG
ncbi:hypothetical protein Tco_1145954 [Tanacetum coccineum]